MWLEIRDYAHTPSARWLDYCGLHLLMREFVEDAWLLSWTHLVDHTSIPLIFQVNLIDQRSFSSDGISMCITLFDCYSLRPTMIVLLLEPFCPKTIVMFLCELLNDMFHHQEDFRHQAISKALTQIFSRIKVITKKTLDTATSEGVME